jgi:hypothetical protein
MLHHKEYSTKETNFCRDIVRGGKLPSMINQTTFPNPKILAKGRKLNRIIFEGEYHRRVAEQGEKPCI